MRAGDLRARITLQRPTSPQNTFGEAEKSWTDVMTVWALVDTPSGDETIGQGRALSATARQVTIRYRSDVQQTWRVKWGDQIMQITAVIDDRYTGEMKLICEEQLVNVDGLR